MDPAAAIDYGLFFRDPDTARRLYSGYALNLWKLQQAYEASIKFNRGGWGLLAPWRSRA
jgi:hypothetical protein